MTANGRARLGLLVIGAVLSQATAAFAVTYWINSATTCVSGCGLTSATGCPSWSCLMATGCTSGAAGCWDNLQNASTADAINVLAGTYAGDGNGQGWCVGANRLDATTGLTIRCADSSGTATPGACTISGTGVAVTESGQRGLVTLGAYPCGADSTTDFVTFQGFRIINPNAGQSAIRGRASLQNSVIRDNTINCTNLDTDCVYLGFGSRISLIKNVVGPCGNGTLGCFAADHSANIAMIGNTTGPNWHGYQGDTINTDALTIQNTPRFLIDGHTAIGPYTNCLDVGMYNATPQLRDGIIRYNDVRDCGRTRGVGDWTGPQLKVSGETPSSQAATDIAIYKNVVRYTSTSNRNGGIWLTESTQRTDLWNNTIWDVYHDTSDGTRASIAVNATSVSTGALPVRYNLIDTTNPTGCSVGQACPLALNGGTACTGAACAWTGNRWWFGSLPGPGTGAVAFAASDVTVAWFAVDTTRLGGGAAFNATGANTGNVRANPQWANGSSTMHQLADFQLTAASGVNFIDAGGAFCVVAGTGACTTAACTIPLSCVGVTTDPRHFFPQPSDYYGVSNAECYGIGTRAAEANGAALGCYDLQIEGTCGRREVASATATTITTQPGPACSWTSGTMVDVPWSGTRPDVGALEYQSDPLPTATNATPTPTRTATPSPSSTPTATRSPTPTLSSTPTPTTTGSPGVGTAATCAGCLGAGSTF